MSEVRIGVDFDNTIVCYDEVFHQAAVAKGLIPAFVPRTKDAVRNYLRAARREDDWTELQGYVYGPGMAGACPFPGVQGFFVACRAGGLSVYIISHKTRHPYRGPAHDLHAAARQWLAAQGFHDPEGIGLPPERVYFALTKQEKLARIREVGCTHFVDDLPEFLAEPAFPRDIAPLLFDPNCQAEDDSRWVRLCSWTEIGAHFRRLVTPSHG